MTACYCIGRIQFFAVSTLLLCLTLAAVELPRELPAQEAPCDPDLNQPAGEPHGYHLRGDRCEGLYIKEVAGSSTLLVASLTESFEDFDPTSGKDLHLEWAALGNSRVWLRGYSLRRRLYYRMDSIRPAGSTSYTWPSGLLATLQISRKDLGIIAWTSYPVRSEKREVYLPLRITQQQSQTRSNSYQILVRPSVDLEKVFVSISLLGPNGTRDSFLRKDEELGYGYYPADRSFPIPVVGLKAAGIYHLEIGAALVGGGSSATELWFYHPNK